MTDRVAAAVVVRRGRVLLIRRRVREGDLLWQFPAGVIEAGETAEGAAVRETREETSVVVIAKTVLGQRVHPDTGRTIGYVACDFGSGQAHAAATDEVAEVAWVPIGQLPEYIPKGVFPPVAAYLQRMLGS